MVVLDGKVAPDMVEGTLVHLNAGTAHALPLVREQASLRDYAKVDVALAVDIPAPNTGALATACGRCVLDDAFLDRSTTA